MFDRVHLNVLVDGAVTEEWLMDSNPGGGKQSVRELAAFLDLALEVAFLVEEVLETKVGLVHVMPGIRCDLFMGTSGGVGFAVEGL